MKTKVCFVWIPLEELNPPKNWSLPFQATYQGRKYKITGVDYIDRVWRAEEINDADS